MGVTDGCSLSPQIFFSAVNCEERTDADKIYTNQCCPISLIFVLFLVVCLKRRLVSSLSTWGSSTIWIRLAHTFHLDRNQHKVSHFGGSRCVKTESSPRRGRLFANVHGQRRSNIIDEEVFSEVRFVSINAILMAVLLGFPLNILLSPAYSPEIQHGTSKCTSAKVDKQIIYFTTGDTADVLIPTPRIHQIFQWAKGLPTSAGA